MGIPLVTPAQRRFAIAMLLVATLFWGMGFAWAKNVGELANRAAGIEGAGAVGPMLMLAVRFIVAAGLWAVVFPQARRGWTLASVRRGALLGLTVFVGVALQHLGLDRASEAVTAFLTNLSVVIVPLMVASQSWRFPALPQVLSLAVALAGIWLLTGAGAGGIGAGEMLGIGCAIAFSFQIVLINRLAPVESMQRLTLAMFVICGLLSLVSAMAQPAFYRIDSHALTETPVIVQIALLATLTTFGAFGLMNRYQPAIDPARAAIVYLFEPIFASAFAWLTEPDAAMTRTAIFGAGLIVLANLLAELPATKPPQPRNAPDD